MFKRLALFILLFVLLFSFPMQAFATSKAEADDTIYFEDGSYITITTIEFETRASGSKSAQRNYSYTTSNGDVCWKATLTGSFTYNGTSATCTSSSCDVTIYESAYYVVSKSAGKSGNTATATVTMGRKLLGITISKDTYNLSLSCDANGNLS